MRFVDLNTFLALPAGTVFSYFEPFTIDELLIKGNTYGKSSAVQDIVGSWASDVGVEYMGPLIDAYYSKSGIAIDLDCMRRDDYWDDKEYQFAVYDRNDIEQMIARLNTALTDAY